MATITKIEINGFKAFPNEFSLDLQDGKNLLMYGENGSGKSSIYYALHVLLQSVFKEDHGAKYFDVGNYNVENLVNIFRTEEAKSHAFSPYVKITLNNGHIWIIKEGGLQYEKGRNEIEIKKMNNYAVFINHSFISRFHAARNSEEIDLWNVFVKDILPFSVIIDEYKSMADFYFEIINEIPKGKTEIDAYKRKIKKFNESLYNNIIAKINKEAHKIYNDYFKNEDDSEINISLSYFADDDDKNNPSHEHFYLAYEKLNGTQYSIRYPKIGINILSSNISINKPQSYFNEAKLTAIALSVRFACLPTVVEDGAFMALDDMLISLDMSNRLKVINYLLNEAIKKYKLYVFTHDKVFFEYFKHKSKKDSSKWLYKEIYMDDNKMPSLKNSETYLGKAEYYIKLHEYEIASSFLRKEAEAFCKEFLPIKLHFSADYSMLDLNGLICNSKNFAKNSGIVDISLFDALDEHRKFVLNPSSHDSYEIAKYGEEVKKCRDILRDIRKISFRTFFTRGCKVEFTLKTPQSDIYKFEITICDDFRLISYGSESVISKGMINYVVYKNGVKGSEVQSDNTTLKRFYDKNYEKSDKSESPNYLDSIIDVKTGNTLRTIM